MLAAQKKPTSRTTTVPEAVYTGLIDRLIAMRSEANTPELLARRSVPGDDLWRGYQLGLDTALDYLVPAAKKLVVLEAHTAHGAECVSKRVVREIVGEVPAQTVAKP